MKTTIKRLAAYLLAVLLVLQIAPVMAGETYTATYTPGYVKYREILEITPEADKSSIMTIDMTNQLSATAGYSNVVWSSDNEGVATVDQTGLVTPVAPGQVRITVEAEGYSDSITFRIVGKTKTEQKANEPAEKIIIIINGEKTKVEYDGQVHTSTYTATSNSDNFDESKLKLTEAGQEHLGSGSDCGTYPDKLTAEDFTYEGAEAEIVISKGWVQIKPKGIKIKADDKTKKTSADPEYTASVTGLLEGDSIDLSQMQYSLSVEEGLTFIDPVIGVGQIIGNYRVETVASGLLTVWKEQPLYNIVQIGNTYYRLAKTQIWTAKVIQENYGKTLDAKDYTVDSYDFKNLTITINNKTYVYQCSENAEAIANGANYYTTNAGVVKVIQNKIGAMSNGKPNWIVPEDQRYNDKNETDSIHRDYVVTLHENQLVLTEQDVYNMLSVNGNENYYRLRKTTIKAIPVEKAEVGKDKALKAGEYTLTAYDFSNVVLTIDGEEYKYSATVPTGEYESCYTVEFENVKKENRFNNDAKWFKNEAGWLDGSKEQIGSLPNDTVGYHANYKATTYKGNKVPRSVTIKSSLEGVEQVYAGTEITLTAELKGFDGIEYDIRWEAEKDGVRTIIPGVNTLIYTFKLTEENSQYKYNVVVTPKE